MSGRSFAGILFSFEKFSSKAFPEFERSNVGLSGKHSNRVVKPALYIGKKTILKIVYKFAISRLFYICRFWDENFQPVCETLIRGVKTAVHLFRGAIWGNMFLEENNLSFFWALFRNLWTSCGKSFNRVGRTINYVSTKTYSEILFCNFRISKTSESEVIYLKTFSRNFSGRWRKLRFTCPVKHSEGKQGLEWKDCSKATSDPGRETVGQSGKLFNIVVKTALYISRSFWREWKIFEARVCLLFANSEMKIFTPPAKIFVRSVKTAFFVFSGFFEEICLFGESSLF